MSTSTSSLDGERGLQREWAASSETAQSTPRRGEEESSSSPHKTKLLLSKLTEQEQLWVIALQDAIRRDGKIDISSLSEFEVACHAIVAKNCPNKAVKRLKRLQAFRQTYKVPAFPTGYQAIQTVHDFVHQHPKFIHAIGKDAIGRWVVSIQMQGLLSVDTPVAQTLTALYYLLGSMQSDLESVRAGTIWIVDWRDTTRQTFPLAILQGVRALCRDAFPIKVQDVPCWNSPPKWSAVMCLCRSSASPHFVNKVVLDCSPATLKEFYRPTLLCKELGGTQTSQNIILDRLQENIERRFENQEHFRLNLP